MGETDWLGIERRIRTVLDVFYARAHNSGVTLNDASDALDQVSEIIGEGTGRGYPKEDADRKWGA